MRSIGSVIFGCIVIAIASCNTVEKEGEDTFRDTAISATPMPVVVNLSDSVIVDTTTNEQPMEGVAHPLVINTKNVHPNDVVSFAETLVGTPYLYASTDPKAGFDCSGFISYIFGHFNIQVPRSSIDFTNVGETIDEREAKRGDIILFTGTNPQERFVGHMGIITTNKPEISFIHSSSGKAHGVTITPLNEHYRKRFVKIIRIFKENNS